jgi:hypothetical protein
MPVPDNIHASELSLTIDGTEYYVATSNFNESAPVVDTTSNRSGGAEEHIYDPLSFTFDYTVLVKASSLPVFRAGQFYECVWSINGFATYTGTAGINSRRITGGARGRVECSGDAKFTGMPVLS